MGFRAWVAKVTGRAPAEVATERPAVVSTPTENDILGALDRVEAMVSGRAAPAPVQSRVRRVAATVRQTLPRLTNLGIGSRDAYAVMATATDYLPEALGGYLRLPRDWADSRPVESGKTSLMLLIDQLDLLGATMDKVFDAVVLRDAEALVVHGRFLAEKFGHPAAPTAIPVRDRGPADEHPRSSLDLP